MSSSLMAAVGKREANNNIKPECVISSGYDPVKSKRRLTMKICTSTIPTHQIYMKIIYPST